MSAIVEAALSRAGLAPVLEARLRGDLAAVRAFERELREADLLVLGALADRIREAEVGKDVRIWAGVLPEVDERVVAVRANAEKTAATGLGFLREVALARILGPLRARVRVDWTDAGLELAQVALGFGASELVGFIASKRGLPIADDAMSGSGKKSARESMQTVKRRELAGFVARSGRHPVFAGEDGGLDADDDVEQDDESEGHAGEERA